MALNIAKWVRQHEDLLLKHQDPITGEVVIDYSKATPLALAPVLIGLLSKTAAVKDALDWLEPSTVKMRLTSDYHEWNKRLLHYVDLNDAAMAASPTKPGSIWWCVTMPLTLGWYPNADCTNVDPDQQVQQTPDVATPLILANAAMTAGAFYDTQNFGTYWGLVADEARGLGTSATRYADLASEWAKDAFNNLKSYVSIQQKIVPWVAGAVIVAGVAYLAFRSGPRTRT